MLFDKDDIPRSAPVKRMHVADAGQGMIEFECPHCGYNSGWITDEWTITENRRGNPCPRCNPESN